MTIINWLSVLGFLAGIISLIKFSRTKPKSADVLKSSILIAISVAIVILTFVKNRRDKETAKVIANKNDSIGLLLRSVDQRTSDVQKARLIDSVQSVSNRKYIIDSLNFSHERQLEYLQDRIDSLLKKTLNKRLTKFQQDNILKQLQAFKNVKCVNVTTFPFSDPRLVDQVLGWLAEKGYEIMGGTIAMTTNSYSFQLVRVNKSLDSENKCINIEVGAF